MSASSVFDGVAAEVEGFQIGEAVEDVRIERFDGVAAEAEEYQIGEAVEDVLVERYDGVVEEEKPFPGR